MSERGPDQLTGADNIHIAPNAEGVWEADTARIAEEPSAETPPAEPEALISPENADGVIDSKKEREQIAVNFVEQAHQKSLEEIAARYKINEGNPLTKFINNTKAFFAFEYKDLEVSKQIADGSPEVQASELKNAFRLFGKEGALRLGKVGAKTGVAGGIGAGVAAILGGTIGSPIFLAALAGGAAARGAFELYRHFKSDEREGRTKVIESRAKVFAEAAKLQGQATALLTERETASDERVAEIDKEMAEVQKYFVELTCYESYQALYADSKKEQQLSGLAEVSKLGHDKMRLEKKREKAADLVAAGGSLIGGILGNVVQSNLSTILDTDIDKVRGVWADFDKNGIQHFVERINPSDIASADPGFAQQLEKTGGFVFNYNGGTAAAEFGFDKAAQVTTAVLNNGSEVHVLSGLNDSIFRNLILQNNPELAERAATLAGNFWKEAVPLAGAQLLGLADFFSAANKDSKEAEKPSQVPDQPAPISSPTEPLPLPGGETKVLPGKKKDEEPAAAPVDSTKTNSPETSPITTPATETGPLPEDSEIVEPLDSSDLSGIVFDTEHILVSAGKAFDKEALDKNGIVIRKIPNPNGNSVTSINLIGPNNFVQTIRLEYPEPEFDALGTPIPGTPRVVLARTDNRERDGWKTLINPDYDLAADFLDEVENRLDDLQAKITQQKEEPVPITVTKKSPEPNEVNEAENAQEPAADDESISEAAAAATPPARNTLYDRMRAAFKAEDEKNLNTQPEVEAVAEPVPPTPEPKPKIERVATGQMTQPIANLLEKNGIPDPELMIGTTTTLSLGQDNARVTELRRSFNIPEDATSVDVQINRVDPVLNASGDAYNYRISLSSNGSETTGNSVVIPLTEFFGLLK